MNYSTFNNIRLEFSTIFVPSFDQNTLKMYSIVGGLNPGTLDHES